jgi:hypothetical protein
MPPIAQPAQGIGPVKVEIVRVAEPRKEAGWWVTTFGTVVIAAAALAVAIVSLVDQHTSEQAAQAAAARTYASQVAFFSEPAGSSVFKIENGAPAPITSVLLLPDPHQHLDNIGTLAHCTTVSITLSPTSKPTIYFRDANGIGWELPAGGIAQQSADPSALLALLPIGENVSSLSQADLNPQPVPGCS